VRNLAIFVIFNGPFLGDVFEFSSQEGVIIFNFSLKSISDTLGDLDVISFRT
jgi:hypothetical protein